MCIRDRAKTVSEKPVEKIDFSKVEIEPLFKDEVDFETFSKSDFRAVKVKECVAVPKSKKLLQFTLDDGTGVERTILSGIHAFYEDVYKRQLKSSFLHKASSRRCDMLDSHWFRNNI